MKPALHVLITALNSKGLRRAAYAVDNVVCCIDHCPEFKGIKTFPARRLTCRIPVLITALNSKGLRQWFAIIASGEMVLITALNSKGLRLGAVVALAGHAVLITALNSKGLRHGLGDLLERPEQGIDHCPEFKGIKTFTFDCCRVFKNVLITALNSKGLRQRELFVQAFSLFHYSTEFMTEHLPQTSIFFRERR